MKLAQIKDNFLWLKNLTKTQKKSMTVNSFLSVAFVLILHFLTTAFPSIVMALLLQRGSITARLVIIIIVSVITGTVNWGQALLKTKNFWDGINTRMNLLAKEGRVFIHLPYFKMISAETGRARFKRPASVRNNDCLRRLFRSNNQYLSNLLYAWNSRNSALTTIQQYLDLMQTEGETDFNVEKTKDTTLSATAAKLTIEFKHVYFKYPEDKEYVLKDLNLKILAGNKIAIIGPNGSGKSTIIKLLLGLYEPNKGKILLNGQQISKLDLTEYQRIFGTVFQDFTLFARSIKDNILMGAPLDKAKLKKVISQVELSDRIKQLPNGLDTSISQELDENGVEFSGGERQKIAIARALYHDSPVVVLDEPTAALDPVAEANIFSKFNELTVGKTAIFFPSA